MAIDSSERNLRLDLSSSRHRAQGNPADAPAQLVLDNVSAWYGDRRVVADIQLSVPINSIMALIGPSGCGKSTLLRCINRMHELTPRARVSGSVIFDGVNLYGGEIAAAAVRQEVGMVFQRANPFPTMSIYDNVATGVRLQQGQLKREELDVIVQKALTDAWLWDEVKERLKVPATRLSGGQQQRLCIARAIATEPQLLLMDEPCSALDPVATYAIEDLIRALAERLTVVIVTHNLQQASRVADLTGFMTIHGEGEPGKLVEVGTTLQIFGSPTNALTEAYVTGRMG